MKKEERKAHMRRRWMQTLLALIWARALSWRILVVLLGLAATVYLEILIWQRGSRATGNRLITMFFALYPLGILALAVAMSYRSYFEVCAAWLKRIKSQRLLSLAAQYARNDSLRGVAVERVSDQALLARLSREDGSAYVRREAVRRVESEEALAYAALHDADAGVRREAVLRVRDGAVLSQVVSNDDSAEVRMTALSRVDDAALLREVANADWFVSALNETRARAFSTEALHTLLEAARDERIQRLLLLALTKRVPFERISTGTRALCMRVARQAGLLGGARFCPACAAIDMIERNSHTESECVYSSADTTVYEDVVVYDEGYTCSACKHEAAVDFAVGLEELFRLYS